MQTRLFVGGKFVDALDGRTIPVRNPHDGSLLAEVAEAGAADVDVAVSAARAAFPGWSATPAAERGRLLLRLADAIEANADELARLETLDTGHPIRDSSTLDVPCTAATFRYFGGMADKYEGSVVPVERGFLNYVLRQPVGVVGQIVPWNFPLMFTSWKMGPALAAGNTVVLKPAELTPLTTLHPATGRAGRLQRLPTGRGQHRARARSGRRRAAGRPPGRAEGLLHRLDRGRPADRAGVRRQPQAPAARAGRQGRQHRLRRRRPGRGGQRLRLRDLPQPGAGVHRRFPPAAGGADRR
jgi:Aldehyde dehydrogenase family